MKTVIEYLSFGGTVSRGRYLVAGLLLFLAKYPLDYAVAVYGFDYSWSPLTYLSVRGGPLLHLDELPELWLSLLAVAAPFLWVGLALTVRRLRSVGASPAWAILFFAPYLNYLFFLALTTLPGRAGDASESQPALLSDGDDEEPDLIDTTTFGRLIPRGRVAAFVLALLASFSIAVTSLFLSKALGVGWGTSLFLVVPFSIGYLCEFMTSYHTTLSFGTAAGVTFLLLSAIEFLLYVFGFEGAGCLIMATPLIFPVALVGSVVARQQGRYRRHLTTPLIVLVGLIPVSMIVERDFPPQPSTTVVHSSIRINAPADVVWRRVVSFPMITTPPEAIFRIGIAKPEQAVIEGRGRGALRRCVFDQGEFKEPIHVWDRERELTFGVLSQPPGLDRYLRVTKGQFLLSESPEGGVVVDGRTWFDLEVYPAPYWHLWSDSIVHTIHMRVLRHIKALAESDARAHTASLVPESRRPPR